MIKHTIVYAENDFDDYFLLKTAFDYARKDIELVHVDDGWELLEYLQKNYSAFFVSRSHYTGYKHESVWWKRNLEAFKSH